MPTSSHDDTEVKELYKEIGNILLQEDRTTVNDIIVGHFNTVIGKVYEQKTVGTYGLGRKMTEG